MSQGADQLESLVRQQKDILLQYQMGFANLQNNQKIIAQMMADAQKGKTVFESGNLASTTAGAYVVSNISPFNLLTPPFNVGVLDLKNAKELEIMVFFGDSYFQESFPSIYGCFSEEQNSVQLPANQFATLPLISTAAAVVDDPINGIESSNNYFFHCKLPCARQRFFHFFGANGMGQDLSALFFTFGIGSYRLIS
jgi:hypothetical protein